IIVRIGVIGLSGLAGEDQGTLDLPLVGAELRQHPQAARVVGVEVERLLQGRLALGGLAVHEQELRLASPCFRVVCVLANDLVHDAQGGIVLPFFLLLEGTLDVDEDVLTAPLELLPAAARTGRVRIESHWSRSKVKGSRATSTTSRRIASPPTVGKHTEALVALSAEVKPYQVFFLTGCQARSKMARNRKRKPCSPRPNGRVGEAS